MVGAIELENSKPGTEARSRLRRTYESCRRHSRYVWTLCALISLVSSKRLFVDLNIHYPSHMHLLHLTVASLYVLASYRRRKESDNSPLLSIRDTLFLAGLSCLMAFSVGFTLQSIVHFPNPTTLAMLPVISCFIESSILFASGHSVRSRSELIRILLILVGCVGICIGEYRWVVKGVGSAIIAALLSGVARALHSVAAESLPNAVSDPWRLNAMFCACAIPLTLGFQWNTDQNWIMFWEVMELKHIPILTVNTLSTAVALVIGKSLLFPVLHAGEQRSPSGLRHDSRAGDATTILILAGVTGLNSVLTLRRSYTTWLQLFAFYWTVLCIGGGSMMDSISGNGQHQSPEGYSKLPDPSTFELEPADGERDSRDIVSDDTNWSSQTRVTSRPQKRRSNLLHGLFTALPLALLWIAFPALNFQDTLYPASTSVEPVLDKLYNTSLPHEIVISMYKEPVEDVKHLIAALHAMPDLSSARVHIYTKDDSANLDSIKEQTDADEVTLLPNIGREGETYLHHIIDSWDTLARQTFFLQADVHNPREFYPRIRDYFDSSRTGMMSLGWSGNVCDCQSCGDRYMFTDRASLFPEIHSRINNATTCSNVLLSYKGQFVVSAARIRGVPKSVYEDLRDAFVNPDSWAHQKEYYQDRFDSLDNPYFGFTMERIWNLLFQCSDMNVAWRCPTLLSGWRLGGSKADCQCFDLV